MIDSHAKLLERIRQELHGCQTAFEVGKYLHELSERLLEDDVHDITFRQIIELVRIKGRSRGVLFDFMKFYRLYSDQPSGLMNQLPDQTAYVLARTVYQGRISRSTKLRPDNFRMPPSEALEIALSRKYSPENLAKAILEGGAGNIGGFKGEGEIEDWFSNSGVVKSMGIQFLYEQVAVGKALRDIEFAARREDDFSVLVLIELKDVADHQSVGQVLGQRNELLENSNNGVAYFYPTHKGSHSKFAKSRRKEEPFTRVESWLIAHVFDASVYFAAKGQDIFLFRVSDTRQIVGPLHAKSMTLEEWQGFGGLMKSISL